MAKNASSALKLGQARGVAIAAGVAQELPVFEYAAREVKKATVGTGRANKEQVAHMVRVLLKLPGIPQADAADACDCYCATSILRRLAKHKPSGIRFDCELTGNLVLIEGNQLLLDVSGVGYEVEVSASVLATSPQAGKSLALYTHFVVREEAQLLFGFGDQRERDLFRAYIRINGVGPKMALADKFNQLAHLSQCGTV